MSELKPCPFCGKEVFLVDVSIQPVPYARWDVCCINHDCFLRGGANNLYITREDAILAWNTLASESAIRSQVIEEVRDGILGISTPWILANWWGVSETCPMYRKKDLMDLLDRMKSEGDK